VDRKLAVATVVGSTIQTAATATAVAPSPPSPRTTNARSSATARNATAWCA